MCKDKSIEIEGQGGTDSVSQGLLYMYCVQGIVPDTEEKFRMDKTCSLLSRNFLLYGNSIRD